MNRCIEELRVISNDALLIQSALDGVRKWRYTPRIPNRQPIEVDTTSGLRITDKFTNALLNNARRNRRLDAR